MLFFYIRHGDPIYTPDSLTPLGHKQADALSRRLCTYGVDEIYSSSSNRAMLTAQHTCEKLGIEMTICPWAHEDLTWADFAVPTSMGYTTWSFFDPEILEIFNSSQVRNLGARWYEHPDLIKYNFGHGVQRINEVVDTFFLSLGYKHDRENARYETVAHHDKRVALFAHGGFGIAFMSSMLDIPYPHYATHFDFGHSSMTVVNFSPRGKYVYPHVLQLSNDSHLYREDLLMTGYQYQIQF